METYHTLADVWNYFDNCEKKQFSFYDITMAINSLPKEVLEEESCKYETMAFGFSENSDGKEWGTYYGPQFVFSKKDTGEKIYIPDLKEVTKETIDYWEKRYSITNNPLLKSRYSGLVLELKKAVTGKEPDYKEIKLGHIQSLFRVVEGDFCEYATQTLDYAKRALLLAVRYNNKDLQEKAARVYYEAHQRLSKDDAYPGIWGNIFQSLIKYRSCFNKYEEPLLKEQLDRFERLKFLALAEDVRTNSYVHVLSEQVDLLSDYYHSIGEDQRIEPLLDSMLEAIKASIPVCGGLWGQGMIQQLQQRYRKYGFDGKANRLFVELQDLGEATLEEMKPTEISIPLNKELVQAFLNEALQGTNEEVLTYFLFQHLPRMEEEKRRMKEKAERFPLLDLASTITIDSSGNPISRVGVGPDVERQKLYFSMYENMQFSIPFMHLHISKMKEQRKMTTDSMMDLLKDSLLITDDHKEIVRRGFEAYMAEDYLVCCHLLVPQLEAAIRRLFALNGDNIMRPKKEPMEGNEYLSLDSLLGSDKAVKYMGEDVANYFRNVLTDQYGWNIRNQVSHGLLATDSFNYGMADRVVHAFLMLSVFTKVEKNEK